MSITITAENGIEFEVCRLGVSIVDHEEQWKGWARLSAEQRRALADALRPKPQPYDQGGVRGADSLLYRAERAERERDAAVARAGQLRDERDDALSAGLEALGAAERERDAAIARAEQAENARDTVSTRAEQLEKALAGSRYAHQRSADAHLEWKSRAKAAEARAETAETRTAPAVSRADVERVVHRYVDGGFDELHVSRVKSTTDAFMDLLSGADPAVHVVRESDIAAVEVQPIDGGKWWLADGALVNTCESPTESEAQEAVDDALATLVGALAARRAIEAEAVVDPVEAKAQELWEVAKPSANATWSGTNELAKEQFRKVAAHVLGQEADDE